MIKSLRAPPPPAGKPAPPTAAARAEDHVATVLDGSATTWARIKAASDLGREIAAFNEEARQLGLEPRYVYRVTQVADLGQGRQIVRVKNCSGWTDPMWCGRDSRLGMKDSVMDRAPWLA